ncbi:TPA: hypothetical protein ACTUT5_000661 [Legionella anisa]
MLDFFDAFFFIFGRAAISAVAATYACEKVTSAAGTSTAETAGRGITSAREEMSSWASIDVLCKSFI